MQPISTVEGEGIVSYPMFFNNIYGFLHLKQPWNNQYLAYARYWGFSIEKHHRIDLESCIRICCSQNPSTWVFFSFLKTGQTHYTCQISNHILKVTEEFASLCSLHLSEPSLIQEPYPLSWLLFPLASIPTRRCSKSPLSHCPRLPLIPRAQHDYHISNLTHMSKFWTFLLCIIISWEFPRLFWVHVPKTLK